MSDVIKQTIKEAAKAGVDFIDRGNGHIQLKGKLLVNYYPESKQSSAYVAGTRHKVKYVTPKQAVEMTFTQPDVKPYTRRRRNTKPIKERLFRKSQKCHWCHAPITLETATLEHIIPLHRGGLDNKNNMTLACKKCNQGRGHDMPELSL